MSREADMDFNASWHAEGLRWIGSLFNGAADYLDRPATCAGCFRYDPRRARATSRRRS